MEAQMAIEEATRNESGELERPHYLAVHKTQSPKLVMNRGKTNSVASEITVSTQMDSDRASRMNSGSSGISGSAVS